MHDLIDNDINVKIEDPDPKSALLEKNKSIHSDHEHLYREYIEKSKKSKRDSKLMISQDNFKYNDASRFSYKRIKHDIEKLQSSSKYHWIIIYLVAIDCFSIITELLIEYIELSITSEKFHFTQHYLDQGVINLNKTHKLLTHYSRLENQIGSYNWLCVLETFFKYLGTSILGIFVIEFVVKLIFTPRKLFAKKWEFIDTIIVITSFSVNLYLIKRHHAVHSTIGLITLLR